MKLRNKKTGVLTEIEEANLVVWNAERDCYESFEEYRSLAELNEEWEDYNEAEEPKRYRLIKYLPTFKEGDEFFLDPQGSLWLDQEIDGRPCTSRVMAYSHKALEKFPNILEKWFEPIEEVKVEPLIKDEKICKAVRAWAEADNLDNFRVHNEHFNACKIIGNKDGMNKASFIIFQTTIAHADNKKLYTIDELCGKEGE